MASDAPELAIKRHFLDFLATCYGQVHYDIELLSGGVVNHTVRARNPGGGDHGAPDSIIIKYAPPFIAGVGPDAPFSQDRQKVEAAALGLFSNGGALTSLPGEAGVRLPRVLRHDPKTSHLVLEDLGSEYVVFWDLFKPELRLAVFGGGLADQVSWFGDLGRAVGHFFAVLHSTETVAAVQRTIAPGEDASFLEHRITAAIVRQHAVDVIPARLTQHGGITETEADTLYQRVLSDFTRDPLGPVETCFALGDSHPGCLLISPTHILEGTAYPAVIDWEFATIAGRGANGDMAQLLSYFHLFLLSHAPETGEHRVVRELVTWLCREYAERSRLSFRRTMPGPDDPRWRVFRSALILHGREMVNQSVEWELGDKRPTQDLVRAGAWYLERAGGSVAEMLEEHNLALLRAEDEGIMLALFNLSL